MTLTGHVLTPAEVESIAVSSGPIAVRSLRNEGWGEPEKLIGDLIATARVGANHGTVTITHARGADFLTHLQEIGAARAKRWHPTPEKEFTGLEWAGAMCGEAGEAANVAKKLRRVELSLVGNDHSERPALPPELIAKLGRELADTLIYMVNVASHYGINLADATVEAFNNKSIELGFPERISRTGSEASER